MKLSLSISNFLEEISSPSHSIIFLYLFAFITEEVFLSLLAVLWIKISINPKDYGRITERFSIGKCLNQNYFADS